MNQFICYAKCSTCQKAKNWLDANRIPYTVRDIKTEHPTMDELKEWQAESGLPLRKFFNTSGMKYKELRLKERLPALSEEEQLQLLASDGMLVKRPLFISGKGAVPPVLIGFREAEWQVLKENDAFYKV